MAIPKVSIVIPNYNHGRYLSRRFESVLGQTFRDFEVIYLDDASTDDSNVIVERFLADGRIRSSKNEVNSGSPFKQWNKGVRLARGEYVWIAEADDYADERFLEKLVKKLDAYPSVGIAYCKSVRVDQNGKEIPSQEDWMSRSGRWDMDFVSSGVEECQSYLCCQNTIPNASAALLRRRVYIEAGYADESMKLCGDWRTWVSMLFCSDVAFVAEPLNYFRLHSASIAARALHSGIYYEEGYNILRYVLSHTRLTDKIEEQACQTMMGGWVSDVVSKGGKVSWNTNRRVYSLAAEVDRKMKMRLMKSVLYHIFKRILFSDPALAILKLRKRVLL